MAKKSEIKKASVKNSDYKELVGFLGKKFEKIDQRFEKIDQRFDQMGLRLDEIMEKKADRTELAAVKDELLAHVDGLAKKIEVYQIEQAMMNNALNRHEKWHFKVAAKAGVDLLKD